MRYRRSISDSDENNDIDISPLIDMVFILLIFFIVTTVFVEETGVEVNKPQAASASQLEKNSILLAITAEGQVVYGGRDIGVRGVRPLVQRMLQLDEQPVIIIPDENVPSGVTMQVIDESKLAGAVVSLAADQPGM